MHASPPGHEELVPVEERLLEFLGNLDLPLEVINGDTPLVTSGLFDSLALFHPVEWIEKEIGSSINPTSLDIRKEWNTVGDILRQRICVQAIECLFGAFVRILHQVRQRHHCVPGRIGYHLHRNRLVLQRIRFSRAQKSCELELLGLFSTNW